MRSSALTGGCLALAVALTAALSSALGLDLVPFVLVGAAVGAAVALIPSASPLVRLLGVGAGAFLALIGYVVRAALLPDITAGRALAFALIVVLVTAVAALSAGRIPLWSTLLGAGVFSGVYESIFSANPPEVVSTSFTTLFALLPAFAVGYLVAVLTEPAAALSARPTHADADTSSRSTSSTTDMENAR